MRVNEHTRPTGGAMTATAEASHRTPTPHQPAPKKKGKRKKPLVKRVQEFSTVESSVSVTVSDKAVRPNETASAEAWAKYTHEKHQVYDMLRGIAGEAAKRMSPVLWHIGDGLRNLKAAMNREGRK